MKLTMHKIHSLRVDHKAVKASLTKKSNFQKLPKDWQHENDDGDGEDHKKLLKNWIFFDVDNVYDAYWDGR